MMRIGTIWVDLIEYEYWDLLIEASLPPLSDEAGPASVRDCNDLTEAVSLQGDASFPSAPISQFIVLGL